MKKQLKSLLIVTIIALMAVPAFGQAPSTEGRDFWVTFLQAQKRSEAELILTISSREACDVLIENPYTGFNQRMRINANSSTSININDKNSCYTDDNENISKTALHVTATKDISLFAANYITKTFDAANILPTPALLDDYLIQTYPPSDHGGDDESRGSHFAIVAVEDNTIVDYTLTARTSAGHTGTQSTQTLMKGEVWYVTTGLGTVGDAADLSGTTVKARNGKKIAVFQGCPHTNIPYKVRDRDHIFSQAMPLAYWGSEFAVTASLQHRRDIVAVMAINDGTEVYINDGEGERVLVHTFNFAQEPKRYWTFEIGEEIAYCNDSEQKRKLDAPLVVDSSCYITTSCPAGVHLFMVSNKYDNVDANGTNNCDPAMLWISPIEQVIKEINFSTYDKGTNVHYMNITTTTADVANVKLDNTSIQQHFRPLRGNSDYSYARMEIPAGNHHLEGNVGFLAHVYGYGVNESYAYSCGSSTIQRSVTFNGTPLMIDSIYPGLFCVNEEIEMKLNIGNNDYQSIIWNYGDGVTYAASQLATNDEKKTTSHVYTAPGWYDLTVSAEYINPCTHTPHNEDMHFSFRVVRADTIPVAPRDSCLTIQQQAQIIAEKGQQHLDSLVTYGETTIINPDAPCYEDKLFSFVKYGLETERIFDSIVRDGAEIDGRWYESDAVVTWTVEKPHKCPQHFTCNLTVITCLKIDVPNNPAAQFICPGGNLEIPYTKAKGHISNATFSVPGLLDKADVTFDDNANNGTFILPTSSIEKAGIYKGTLYIEDHDCDSVITVPIDFTVKYPSDIFKFKFNNVLAVYQNTGYEFTAYQWVVNDEPVLDANSSIYYLGQGNTFNEGDVVYVLLTDKDGLVLPSCPQTLTDIQDYNPEPEEPAQAHKKIVNRRFVIQRGEDIYDIYGQKVK